VVPHALRAADGLYLLVFRATESRAVLTLVQVVVSAIILLPPTFLMGGTLPVLSRFVATRRGGVGPAVGLLYGLNTLGAAAGTFLSGFFLVKALGTLKTIYVAAAGNLALALAFLALHAFWQTEEAAAAPEEEVEAVVEAPLGMARMWVLVLAVAISGFVAFSYEVLAVAISGFVAFSYEVLWVRLLTFKFKTTVYAFSIMLTTFLLGLGLGGAAVGFLRKKLPKADYWRVYGYLEAGVAISGLATILLFFQVRHGYSSFAQRVIGEFGTSALIMLVPTTLMGAAFPIACHLYASGVERTGRSVGSIYVFNTIGAIAGAMVTGFYLVKVLGSQKSLTLASFIMALSATVLLVASPAPAERRRSLARKLAPLPVIWALVLTVWGITPSEFLRDYFLRNQSFKVAEPDSKVKLLGFEEGTEGIVVATQAEDGRKMIAAGPVDVAGTGYVCRNTQIMQAHIPMLIHPNPKEVCQIGFGSGETASIFSSYDVDQFDCVEISPAMIEIAAKHFTDINHDIVEKRPPKFNPIIMDATTYFAYTDRKYDVIANDATWPAHSGTTLLFTLEHFRNGRDHLKPGGMMTSWLPYDMPVADFKTVLKTFHEVFPHVYVWAVLSRMNRHSLIVGANQPIQVDLARFVDRFDRFARDDLREIYLDDPALFLACHLSKLEGRAPGLRDVPLHTQDLPRLQYLFSRPEEYMPYREPKQLTEALQVFDGNRDSILNYLTNWDGVAQADVLREQIRRADLANNHFLRSYIHDWDDRQKGAAEFQQGMRLAPNHPAARMVSAVHRALAVLSDEEIKQQDLEALKATAGELFLEGYYEKALVALQEWARREPASAGVQQEIGLVYINTDRPDMAIRHLRRARELDPDLRDVNFNLGAAYLATRQLENAVAHFKENLSREPRSADTMERLGVAYAMTGENEAARKHLEEAVTEAPDLAQARVSLAVFFLNQGMFAQAIPHLEKLVQLRPQSARAHSFLADAYAKTGNRAAAARHAELAAKLQQASSARPAGPPTGER
jgi:spermidine synthase